MTRRHGPILGALLALSVAIPASAAPITSPGSLDPGKTVIDFQTTAGDPEPFGDSNMTITSNTGNAVVRSAYADVPGIKEGLWAGCLSSCEYTILFSTNVSDFGLGIVHEALTSVFLTIYDDGGSVLEQTEILPMAAGSASFHGFVRPIADIASVELSAPAFGYVGMDNVSYFITPAPATGSLLSLGLLGLALSGRKRRTRVSSRSHASS